MRQLKSKSIFFYYIINTKKLQILNNSIHIYVVYICYSCVKNIVLNYIKVILLH